MLQVLPHQQKQCNLAVLGEHHLDQHTTVLTFWQFIKICRKYLPNGKNRIFHARRNDEMIQALLAKKLFRARIKIVFTSTAQRHHSKFTKWLMNQMDSIITTCHSAGNYIERKADIIIPHGIDITRYSPAENREEAWKKTGFPGKRGIGIFGRIRPSKGIDTFIDAVIPILKKDINLTAIICGETIAKFQSYQKELKQKITDAQLSDRILFIGEQDFDQLPLLFQSVSVTIAASRNEGYGLTVLESMASGTPVVATDAGAWKDIIIEGENGYCVSVDAPSEMEQKLSTLLQQDIDVFGKNARQHVKAHYTTEKEAMALCNHLFSLR